MAKVTSKLQVTVPKAIADRYGIRPGDDIEWQPAGGVINVLPAGKQTAPVLSRDARLRLYDSATLRQRRRQKGRTKPRRGTNRGWRREDLYTRDRAR